jgi:hypothetical protein
MGQYGGDKKYTQILVRKLEGKRHRWESNIKMDLIPIGCGMDSSGPG